MVAQLTSNSIKMVGNFRVFVLTSSLLIFLIFSRVLAKDDLGMLRDNHDGLSSSNILLNNFFNFDFLEDLISPKRVGVQINLILSPPSRMDIPSTRIIAALGAASTTADKPTEQPTGQPSIMYVAPTPPEDIVTQMPTTAFNATDHKLSNYPTSQPSTLFIAPTRPEDFVTTMPTAALGSIGQQDSSSPSMKSEGSLPVSGGGVGNRGNVAGAQNIGEELQDEHDTALSSAKYFFLTFLVCLGLFAGIHIIKRYCQNKSLRNC